MINKKRIFFILFCASFFCQQSRAGSDVDLTVTGTINEGTCTLSLDNTALVLGEISTSNTRIDDEYGLGDGSSKDFNINISDCSPGHATHAPAIKFSGNVSNNLWRDPRGENADNDAGEAYGVLLHNRGEQILSCEHMNKTSILDGYCTLGEKDTTLDDKKIEMRASWGKSSNEGLNASAGGVKASINIAFEYH